MGELTALPDSATLALWYSAWTAGFTSLDEARDRVVGSDAEHHVAGMPGEGEAVPLILALGKLRAEGATSAGIALPVPGDPLGLAGPPAFNTSALEVEQAVVFDNAELGLVPHRAGRGVVWQLHGAAFRAQSPDLGEADTGLRQALLSTASSLAELDVARWRPEVADALLSLRRHLDLHLPPEMAPRAVQVATLAIRCRAIVELALRDDGAAVSAYESDARRAALAPLAHAARRGLVAACSHPLGR